jgi:lipoprotein-releasing system ATP-binding protein
MDTQIHVLQAKNLTKFFLVPTRFKVLDDVSFNIHKGEFLTLMGKSGSGKSTLLYCLSTMDTDYSGEIVICGKKVTGLPSEQLATIRNQQLGFVFQFHYLLPEFSCLKNIMLPALKLGRFRPDEIEAMAYQKMELLGIADQALKPASKLSGGQQQRVSIARALINNPSIIMCDEPTGNLDSKNAGIVLDTFRALASDFGQSIIAVTHDEDFAHKSDRTIELFDGKMMAEKNGV